MEPIDELKETERSEKADVQLTEDELDKVAGGLAPNPLNPDPFHISKPVPVPVLPNLQVSI